MPDTTTQSTDPDFPSAEPTLRALAMPADTNPHGDIFGGWLVGQMDLAGTIIGTRHAKGRVVTVAITEMAFHHPVMVGDEVTCFGAVSKVGHTSITIGIQAWVRRGTGSDPIKVTEGLFTYVHVGEDGRPLPIS